MADRRQPSLGRGGDLAPRGHDLRARLVGGAGEAQVAAFLGVLALVLAVLATGSLTPLSLLVADIVVLWAVSTLGHTWHMPAAPGCELARDPVAWARQRPRSGAGSPVASAAHACAKRSTASQSV